MDRALIIGASGGIGQAIAANLEGQGVEITRLSRAGDGLDITDEASIAAHLGALTGPYDLVFVATGALVINGAEPEKSIRALEPQAMMDQFRLNAMGPALVLKHARRLLPKNKRAVFAVLSARVGSIGDNALGGWHSYRTAKAALNQLMHGAAIELARSHREAVVACLHPGTVETAFTAKYASSYSTVPPEEAAGNLLGVITALTPAQTGGFFDYAGREIPW